MDAKKKLEEKHSEGRYYLSRNGGWIDAGTDALEAQRKRKQRLALDEYKRLSGKASSQSSVVLPGTAGRITLAAAENISPTTKPVALIPKASAVSDCR